MTVRAPVSTRTEATLPSGPSVTAFTSPTTSPLLSFTLAPTITHTRSQLCRAASWPALPLQAPWPGPLGPVVGVEVGPAGAAGFVGIAGFVVDGAGAVGGVTVCVGTDAIVERYVDGRELDCGVIGNQRVQVLPVWEMTFSKMPDDQHRIATERVKWSAKYQAKMGIVTAEAKDFPEGVAERVQHVSKRAYKVLELSGYARIDLRLDGQGRIHVLEANPNPQIALTEDFAASAAKAGLPYPALLQRIVTTGLRWEPEGRVRTVQVPGPEQQSRRSGSRGRSSHGPGSAVRSSRRRSSVVGPVRQIRGSPNHQITKSPNHRFTRSPIISHTSSPSPEPCFANFFPGCHWQRQHPGPLLSATMMLKYWERLELTHPQAVAGAA